MNAKPYFDDKKPDLKPKMKAKPNGMALDAKRPPPRVNKAPVARRGGLPAGDLTFNGKAATGGKFAAEAAQKKAERQVNSLASQKQDEELACKSPDLKPFDDSIRHLLEKTEKPQCNGTTLTYLSGSRFIVDRGLTVQVKYDTCYYSYMERVDDDTTRVTDPKKVHLMKQGSQLDFKVKNDFTILGCQKGPQQRKIDIIDADDPSMHVDVHAHVVERPEVKETCARYLKKRHKDNMGLNVIMFGIESTSRMNFMRQMPRSYR